MNRYERSDSRRVTSKTVRFIGQDRQNGKILPVILLMRGRVPL